MKKENQIPDNFENRLDEFAPNLFSIKNDNPFEVPADYFDSLPEKIASKIIATKKENSFAAKFRIIFNPKIYIPVAASILIVVFLIFKSTGIKTRSDQQMAYTANDNSAEYQYADSLIENGDIDESMLLETLTGIDDTSKNGNGNSGIEKNIRDMNKSTIIVSDSLKNLKVTDDDIIQYLLDNDDNDDLINN